MKKNLLLISALALSCIGVAQAETVNFSGTVTTSCAFSNSQTGALSASTQGNNYILDAGFNNPGAATMQVAYTGAPTFSIDAVSNVSGSNGVPSIQDITTGVSFGEAGNQANANSAGANQFTTGTKTFQLDGTANIDTVAVKMVARATSPFAVGTYTAQTTVTCQ